eukprot:CAMPEP_0174330674 /NCGR_PEP_ID=MMETSP0810-20121108/16864_1 /TAXON_ID=73025 ORGANISM="Eutreptiella gymnastica-like, Strain CCMP1594" /NCGR_SAMPLE_ID=MMETSP0810 /ASSEMBLY_ACC=CAM_ASM_000659 /LENGTH=46 /DNA_ID= /DNA_START= /DNA_END= /DNA_ORIENTATION=
MTEDCCCTLAAGFWTGNCGGGAAPTATPIAAFAALAALRKRLKIPT